MADRLPDFRIPIDDRHAADFWLVEWMDRYRQTSDWAFRELVDGMLRYIDQHFGDEEEGGEG